MHEGRQPDRTDHRRAVENRRHDRRGPSESRIAAALETVATHDVPGTPRAGTLKVLRHLHESDRKTDTRTVRDFSIRRGKPRHGAKRSDDHVGEYEVELPATEVTDDVLPGDACPECNHERVRYDYHAFHYIAGGEAITCARCEATLHEDEWG